MASAIEIIDNSESIEPVTGNVDLKKVVKEEKFMEEIVVVMIHPGNNENDAPYAHLNVNGMNQIIPRGQNVPIKRKYLEVLARMKETRYNQVTRNPSAPDQVDMVARHGLVYPFDLVEDPNPKGRGWLNNVLAEAA